MLFSLDKINKFYGADHVLKDITAAMQDDDRIGLIGANGAGKSTLLNIIVNTLDFDSGIRDVNRHTSIGFLRQNSGLNENNTIYTELKNIFTEVNTAMDKLSQLEREMSVIKDHSSEHYLKLTREYTDCESIINAADGYNIDVRINTVLNGLSLGSKPLETQISSMSGGEKTRLAICKLLLISPKLLILDEPTNHLDFKALLWLEDYLKNYKGALLIVSHDRYFLDSLVTKVWEIEHGHLNAYTGNYTKYLTLKDEEIERSVKEYNENVAKVAKLEEYVAKNIARASTSKSAKSKQKAIERIDISEKPITKIKSAKLRFEYDREPVKDVLDVSKLKLSVGEDSTTKLLLEDFDFHVFRGEKIAIIGENGVGKSSFLKAIQDLIPFEGEITWGKHSQITYFEQENTKLNPEKTALDEIWDRFPTVFEHRIRNALGAILITGEECYKKVQDLSGGESAKLKFAIMSLERGNVLIMDEPTNHLDLMTKEVLDSALSAFTGTLIMISHDRYLLSKVPTKIVEFTKSGPIIYKGNYNDYISHAKSTPTPAVSQEVKQSATKTQYAKGKEMRSILASLRSKKTELERVIKENEDEQTRLENAIASGEYKNDYEQLSFACTEIDKIKELLENAYEQWLEVSEELAEKG